MSTDIQQNIAIGVIALALLVYIIIDSRRAP